MRLKIHKKYKPANDVVFSVMFESVEMFTRLLSAVTKEQQNIVSVVSQASRYNETVDEKTIRFDTRGVDNKGRIYSMDMQRTYFRKRHINRTVYYASREISKQEVLKFRYEDLLSVSVTFLITDRKDHKIEMIQLRSEDGQVYTDLMTMYNVYLPKSIDRNTSCDDVDVFMDFLAIEDVAMAEQFEKK